MRSTSLEHTAGTAGPTLPIERTREEELDVLGNELKEPPPDQPTDHLESPGWVEERRGEMVVACKRRKRAGEGEEGVQEVKRAKKGPAEGQDLPGDGTEAKRTKTKKKNNVIQ